MRRSHHFITIDIAVARNQTQSIILGHSEEYPDQCFALSGHRLRDEAIRSLLRGFPDCFASPAMTIQSWP